MNFLGLNLLRLWAIVRKEAVQIRRDPVALRLAIFMPVIQLTLFGYAVNTDVQHIPMAVADQCHCASGRLLTDMYVNTLYFDIVRRARNARELIHLIDAGRVKAGLFIPPDYDRHLLRGEQAQVQFLIDGTDSSTASQGLSVANLVAQTRSVQLISATLNAPVATPIDFRPRVLYNPDLKSSNFFVPGLLGIILQMIAVILTSFS
ncbi:MAG: ABC transporter permease, partial [Nevskia sp.]|nr:ABC transporter permease [Nevskia sp.]